MTATTQESRAKLAADFKTLTTDAEALLRATAAQTGEQAAAARAKLEESMRLAKEKIAEIQGDAIERARAAAKAADEVVHEKPWQSIAVAAAVGFFLGWLSGRK